jgi:hypothetical protein
MKKMSLEWRLNARLFATHSQPLLFWVIKANPKAKIKAKNEASRTQKPGPNAQRNDEMMK